MNVRGDSSRGGRNGRGRGRNTKGRGRNIFERKLNPDSSQARCNTCKRSSHVEKDCWFKGKPQCYNCKKFGHFQKDCRFKDNQQANFSEEYVDDDHLFYAYQAASEQMNNVWYIDSGCSNHTTGDESLFVNMDASSIFQVKMGNGALVETKGKGTIAIETKKGTKYIQDVLLVPDLAQNLLRVG